MTKKNPALSVGDVAKRSGMAVSAIHFYERKGLISASRTEGNQRRYERDVLRRLALIRAAQQVGIPLSEVGEAMAGLPAGRTPTPKDWRQIASRWAETLEKRLILLQRLRDNLDSCIGCGCLSMRHCHLVNPGDALEATGASALMGFMPSTSTSFAVSDLANAVNR
eukprot:gene13465-17877_t